MSLPAAPDNPQAYRRLGKQQEIENRSVKNGRHAIGPLATQFLPTVTGPYIIAIITILQPVGLTRNSSTAFYRIPQKSCDEQMTKEEILNIGEKVPRMILNLLKPLISPSEDLFE